MRVRFKMCGITDVEQAGKAVAAGVDALGFVFCQASYHNVAVNTAAEIISTLPAFVDSVGVFADEDAENVIKSVVDCKLNHLQFHGKESVDYCLQFARTFPGLKIIKAFTLDGKVDFELVESYREAVHAILFGLPTGLHADEIERQLDVDGIGKIAASTPVILSGGLTPDNIEVLVRLVQPFAIDINSGMAKSLVKQDRDEVDKLVAKVTTL